MWTYEWLPQTGPNIHVDIIIIIIILIIIIIIIIFFFFALGTFIPEG